MFDYSKTIDELIEEISSKFDEYRILSTNIDICIGKPSFARHLKDLKKQMLELHQKCKYLEEDLSYKLSIQKNNNSESCRKARDILGQARQIFVYI
jgi:hypothetical protein